MATADHESVFPITLNQCSIVSPLLQLNLTLKQATTPLHGLWLWSSIGHVGDMQWKQTLRSNTAEPSQIFVCKVAARQSFRKKDPPTKNLRVKSIVVVQTNEPKIILASFSHIFRRRTNLSTSSSVPVSHTSTIGLHGGICTQLQTLSPQSWSRKRESTFSYFSFR